MSHTSSAPPPLHLKERRTQMTRLLSSKLQRACLGCWVLSWGHYANIRSLVSGIPCPASILRHLPVPLRKLQFVPHYYNPDETNPPPKNTTRDNKKERAQAPHRETPTPSQTLEKSPKTAPPPPRSEAPVLLSRSGGFSAPTRRFVNSLRIFSHVRLRKISGTPQRSGGSPENVALLPTRAGLRAGLPLAPAVRGAPAAQKAPKSPESSVSDRGGRVWPSYP